MISSEFDFYVIMLAQAVFIGVATINLTLLWLKDYPNNDIGIFLIIYHYIGHILFQNLIFVPLFFLVKYFFL